MFTRFAWVMGLGVAAAVASGCSGGGGDLGAMQSAVLTRASSCQDLQAALRADARAKVNAYFDGQEYWLQHRSSGGLFGGGVDVANAGAAPPKSSDTATDYSQTNTQVAGVDEADIVKNDGKYIYDLHGSSFKVIQAFPADQLQSTSSVGIEGYPSEMFVDSGRAVIFSSVPASPVFAAAGVPRKTPYGYWGAGWWGGAWGAPACLGWSCGTYISDPVTKVTVLSLADVANPQVVREMYFEGSYLSSRRIGSHVRAVLTGDAHFPELQYYPQDYTGDWSDTSALVNAYEKLRAKDLATIDAMTAADWLPFAFEKTGGKTTGRQMACQDYYTTTAGSTEYGLTQVVSFNLDQPAQAPGDIGIEGSADTLYSSADTMVLASRGWRSNWWWDYDQLPVGFSFTYTHLHAFDIASDPEHPTYLGSGTLPGMIKDQFSLDEKGGVIRVATTEARAEHVATHGGHMGFVSIAHVFTMGAKDGRLVQLGSAGDIADNEQIMSTRFVGDHAYVVTYRSVDPLFVVDTSNAADPKLVGSLSIPGFSEYMQPIDDTHLLTIGKDGGSSGAWSGNLALQLFDVSNPTAPALVSKYSFAGQWGYSEAEYQHKAFTWYPQRGLLSFPYWTYDPSYTTMHSTAELFKVDLKGGISHVGSVDHTPLFGSATKGYCGGYMTPMVRRSVFMDDDMYSVSYGGVVATNTLDMSQVKTLSLGAPVLDGYCY